MASEETIFGKALEFASSEARRAYVEGACAGDDKLAKRVEKLLSAYGDADDEAFMPTVAIGNEAPIHEGEGSVIGRYKLLQKLGEGGFGVVYMAEQREPVRRRVALKIIKLGMDTKHVVGRFEAERQALAMMQHPNIANVLDGGATEHGRPYFVMELVRGVPVTQYCDEKQLTTEDRLRLFRDICGAVQHAHQKGIIHRDLKPGNVLVTIGDGNKAHPKVIDFGIAKATQQELTDKTLFTRFEDFVGTPAYMSPEQAQHSQLDIDTRTDIYSLGVLLYELLTGRTPFDSDDLINSGVDEIRRRIRDEDPPRPSTRLHSLAGEIQTRIAASRGANPLLLQKKLRNEIDWIIMKAIEKDRGRRYGTAEALADDIDNYLNNAPVEACPPSPAYRFRKMIRRHKGAFTVAGAVVAALGVGAMVSTWQAIRVSIANDRATELLRNSYLVQAGATRKTTEPGRRYESLATIKKAASIRPSLELRNEAIAAMALPDMRPLKLLDLQLPETPNSATAVDPDGERYAIGNSKGEVRLCRIDDQSEITTLPAHDRAIGWLRFSPDGAHLAVFLVKTPGGDGDLIVWDLKAMKTVFEMVDAQWGACVFSRDARQIAVGIVSSKTIVVHDLGSGAMTTEIPCGYTPRYLAFDPAGTRLAVGAHVRNNSSDLVIYGLPGGDEIGRLTHPRHIKAVDWHPGGEELAVGCSDFNVYTWHVASGKQLNVLRGHQAEVIGIYHHPGGRYLGSTSWDGTTRIWEPHAGECLLITEGTMEQFIRSGTGAQFRLTDPSGGIWEFTESSFCFSRYHLEGETSHKGVAMAFSPNSAWLAGSSKSTSLWDLRTKERIATSDFQASGLVFEGNSTRLLAGGRTMGLRRYVISGGGEGGQLAISEVATVSEDQVNHFAVSEDGRAVAVTLQNKRQAHLLDAASGEIRATFRGQSGMNRVALNSTGSWLATGSWHGRGVRVWRLDDPDAEPVDLLVDTDRGYVSFEPGGGRLVTGTSHGYQIWKLGSWDAPEATIPGLGRFDFDPAGGFMACRLDNGAIGLVDLKTFEVFAELRAPIANLVKLTTIAVSPDGAHVAAATARRDVFVWNLSLMRGELAQMGLDWE